MGGEIRTFEVAVVHGEVGFMLQRGVQLTLRHPDSLLFLSCLSRLCD